MKEKQLKINIGDKFKINKITVNGQDIKEYTFENGKITINLKNYIDGKKSTKN